MNLDELLVEWSRQGIRLWAEGSRLRYRGPPSRLTPELLAFLSRHKRELMLHLNRRKSPFQQKPIEPQAGRSSYPLSFAQQRLWFLEQLEPGTSVYNMPIAWQLEGRISLKELRWAVHALAQRHDVLRTRLEVCEGEAQAVVETSMEFKWEEKDAQLEAGFDWRERLREEASRPLDLGKGPLWRGGVMRIAEESFVLWLVMHHMIGDAWSLGIIERELSQIYEARLQGGEGEILPSPRLQYGDYALWQKEWLSGSELERQMQFWKKRLEGVALLTLPVDGVRKAHHAGGRYRQEIGAETVEQIRRMSREMGVTSFMSFLGGLALMLSRYSRQDKVVVGMPIANRTREEIEGVVGFFANTLAMVVEVRREETVRDFLERLREESLDAYDHQDLPFEKLVEALSPERDLERHPLFQVMLSWQDAPREIRSIGRARMREVEIERGTAKFDFEIVLEPKAEGGLVLVVEYALGLFEETTIRRMIGQWLELMNGMTAQPDGRIDELPMMQITNLVLASTFTAEPLEETLQFWSKQLDLPWQITFAPYNQVFQQLLDPASAMMGNEKGANLLLVRLKDWNRMAGPPGRLDSHESPAERVAQDLVAALKSAAPQMKVPCVLCICSSESQGRLTSDEEKLYGGLEERLVSELRELSGLVLIRSAEVDALYPVTEKYDPLGDKEGHVPYTPDYFTALGTLVARRLYALQHSPYKVIVADCDQTLWAGRCGEDGPNGIVVDAPRSCLQRMLISKMEEGFLLCLCSKNNEEEVLQTFKANPNMPLTLEALVNWRINWKPKSENLRSLAAELNLGLDSFIFIDDDSLECEEVRRHCPEVLVLQLPEREAEIPDFLSHVWALDRWRVTAEDRQRSQLYQQDRERTRLEKASLNFQEFLEGLGLTVACLPLAQEDLPRAAQLTQRTNQFNVSTQRRNEAELERLLQSEGSEGWMVQVHDRFGDYGSAGLMITVAREDCLWVDTFLLSCRVLGRGVEYQMLAWLGKRAQQAGLDWVEILCRPNAKNRPAIDFLESTGSAYRVSHGQDWSIRFPVEVAAAMVFRPPQNRSATKVQEQAMSSASPSVTSQDAALQRIPRIARELREVNCIQASLRLARPQVEPKREGYAAPRGEVETVVASVWEEALGVKQVGVHDNFFHLGGHSLLATRMLSQIARIFQVQPSLQLIFESPTLEGFTRGLIELEPQAGQIKKIASIYLAIGAMSEEEQDAYLAQMQGS